MPGVNGFFYEDVIDALDSNEDGKLTTADDGIVSVDKNSVSLATGVKVLAPPERQGSYLTGS